MGTVPINMPEERGRLREWWGITIRAEWQSALRPLLACESHSSVWDFALGLRHTIAQDFGGHVDPGYWRRSAANVLRANTGGATVLTADGVTKTDPPAPSPRPRRGSRACSGSSGASAVRGTHEGGRHSGRRAVRQVP
ncbi:MULTISPECIES: hypothetical protein [unclassified Streptomyces]|uniref:hypothetical protein n=1 Tax=unclassified Streptomyces TaxID=2593676 RepID=UPI0036EB02B3